MIVASPGVTLVLTRKGYKTKTVKVDANSPRQVLSLDPAAGPAPRANTNQPAGGIDDIGDPFAKKR